MQRHGACGEGWRLWKRQSRIATWPELDATTARVPPLYWHYTRPPCCASACFTVLSSLSLSLSLASQFTRLPRSLYNQHVLSCAVVARSRVLNALLTVKTRHLTADHEVLDHRSRAFKACRADNTHNGYHRVHGKSALWRVEQLACSTTQFCEEPSKWYVEPNQLNSTRPVQ